MGYYTKYSLQISRNDNIANEQDIIEHLCNFSENAGIAIDINGESVQETKWYEHDKDMKEFSKLYPSVLFELNGEGEESGDIWKTYYRDGKSQQCKAIVSFENFDPSKLK